MGGGSISDAVVIVCIGAGQGVAGVGVGFAPEFVVETGEWLVDLVQIPDFVIENEDEFGEVDDVGLPFVKRTVVGITN